MKLTIIAFLFGLALLVTGCSDDSGQLLFVDAVDYDALEPEGGCPQDPENALYRACIDTGTLYAAAVESSKSNGNPLMVVWGFNECPYCKVFDGENFNPDRPWKTKDFISKLTPAQRSAMSPAEQSDFQISVVRLHSRTQHGLDFADKIGVTDLARARGWHRVWSPFIMVVDPESGKIHTEEKWNAQWSFCESSSEFIVNLVAVGALPSDGGHAWPMCASS